MLCILVVVGVFGYNIGIRDPDEMDSPLRPSPVAETPTQPQPQTASRQQQAKYSFYDQLKKHSGEVQAEVEAKSQALQNTPAVKGTYYRVQVGAFKDLEEADRLRARLILRDYPVTILQSNNFHLVQVGPYPDRDAAVKVEQNLKKSGFNVLLKKFESN